MTKEYPYRLNKDRLSSQRLREKYGRRMVKQSDYPERKRFESWFTPEWGLREDSTGIYVWNKTGTTGGWSNEGIYQKDYLNISQSFNETDDEQTVQNPFDIELAQSFIPSGDELKKIFNLEEAVRQSQKSIQSARDTFQDESEEQIKEAQTALKQMRSNIKSRGNDLFRQVRKGFIQLQKRSESVEQRTVIMGIVGILIIGFVGFV